MCEIMEYKCKVSKLLGPYFTATLVHRSDDGPVQSLPCEADLFDSRLLMLAGRDLRLPMR